MTPQLWDLTTRPAAWGAGFLAKDTLAVHWAWRELEAWWEIGL